MIILFCFEECRKRGEFILKSLGLLLFIISFFTLESLDVHAQPKECPVLSELERTSIKDTKEVIEALNTLIPKTYGSGIDDFPDIYTNGM